MSPTVLVNDAKSDVTDANRTQTDDGKSNTAKESATLTDTGCDDNCNKTEVVTKIQIAPSTTELSDRRAVRSRRRRERPRKVQLNESGNEQGADGAEDIDLPRNHFQPDIESFVSNCIPGMSILLPVGSPNDDDDDKTPFPARRAGLIRKRSLPMLSFLSSTALAAAEKKRKKEEQERLQALGEEAAKNLQVTELPDISLDNELVDAEAKSSGDALNADAGLSEEGKRFMDNAKGDGGEPLDQTPAPKTKSQEVSDPPSQPTKTTVTRENTSNILMPPLVEKFLASIKCLPR